MIPGLNFTLQLHVITFEVDMSGIDEKCVSIFVKGYYAFETRFVRENLPEINFIFLFVIL